MHYAPKAWMTLTQTLEAIYHDVLPINGVFLNSALINLLVISFLQQKSTATGIYNSY